MLQPHSRSLVILLGEADAGPDKGVLGRLFGGGHARIARPVRGSALLVRGYTRLGGGVDVFISADALAG